jgi:hypothetical protein
MKGVNPQGGLVRTNKKRPAFAGRFLFSASVVQAAAE